MTFERKARRPLLRSCKARDKGNALRHESIGFGVQEEFLEDCTTAQMHTCCAVMQNLRRKVQWLMPVMLRLGVTMMAMAVCWLTAMAG